MTDSTENHTLQTMRFYRDMTDSTENHTLQTMRFYRDMTDSTEKQPLFSKEDWIGIFELVLADQAPSTRQWLKSEYPTQEQLLDYIQHALPTMSGRKNLNYYYGLYKKYLSNPIEKKDVSKKELLAKPSTSEIDNTFKEYLKAHQIKIEKVEDLAYMCNLSKKFIAYRKDNAMEKDMIVCTVLNRGSLFQPISNVERSKLTKLHTNNELLDAHREYPTIYQRGNQEFRVYGPYLDMGDATVFKFLLSMYIGKDGFKISTTYQDIAELIQPTLRIKLKKDQISKMKRSLTRLSQSVLEVTAQVTEKRKVSFSGTLIACKVTDNKNYNTVFDVTINPYLIEHLQSGYFSHINGELLTNMTEWETKLALTLLVDKWESQQFTVNQIKEIFGKSSLSDKHVKDYMRKAIKDLVDKKVLEPSSCYKGGTFYLVKT